MSSVTNRPGPAASREGPDVHRPPPELLELRERVRRMPPPIRAELEPIVEEAMEDARFRGGALALARDALSRLRLDLALVRFDLDMTRREREDLRRILGRQ